MLIRGLIGGSLLLATVSVSAASDDAVKPRKEQKSCRSERVTGTRLARQICHTAAEWTAIEQATNSIPDRATQATVPSQLKSTNNNGLVPFGPS